MGCVACINTIDSVLRQTTIPNDDDDNNDALAVAAASRGHDRIPPPPRVLQAASSLLPLGAKGGQAQIQVQASNESELHQLVHALVESVQAAGFDSCQVQSVVRAVVLVVLLLRESRRAGKPPQQSTSSSAVGGTY